MAQIQKKDRQKIDKQKTKIDKKIDKTHNKT